MYAEEFKNRTKRFALDVIALGNELPRNMTAQVIGKQLLRCATSVRANYRAACRGHSPAEMFAKLHIVEEEADECLYWLDLLAEADIVSWERIANLRKEADELTAMVVASQKTLRAKLNTK